MKIAIVHDFMIYHGGAEFTLKKISEIFSEAEIYTLLKNEGYTNEYFSDKKIKTSFLQKLPGFLRKKHKWLLPLLPIAPETLNLREANLVISSSSGFAKGVVLRSKTTHVCYMHAPMRYVWDWNHEYLAEQKFGGFSKFFLRFFLSYLRMWDRASAERVDYFYRQFQIHGSEDLKYYRKESAVIYPPVDTKRIKPQNKHEGYFLAVGRLSPYKRNKLLAEAFVKLGLPLVIAGMGQEEKELKELAAKRKNIKVLGWITDEQLIRLYQNARAFVTASVDDFNITAVEAMAAGKPVLALREGGVRETVLEGITGEFFEKPETEEVIGCVRKFISRD